jgi:hypothetical protein
MLHCSSCAEVAVTLNEAEKKELPGETAASLKKPPLSEDGATPESAIRVHASNCIEGIPKEYAILRAMFGTPNKDWKLINRCVIDSDRGRKLEKFALSSSGKRKEIYFDITEWLRPEAAEEARITLDELIRPNDKAINILIPREEFMTLQVGVLRLTEAQLNQIGLTPSDRKSECRCGSSRKAASGVRAAGPATQPLLLEKAQVDRPAELRQRVA